MTLKTWSCHTPYKFSPMLIAVIPVAGTPDGMPTAC
jgi:hypothetical protein